MEKFQVRKTHGNSPKKLAPTHNLTTSLLRIMTADDTDQAKRSALLDKITALLAKTQHNGCTEAEAIAAAELHKS
jgi:hypothetical protein